MSAIFLPSVPAAVPVSGARRRGWFIAMATAGFALNAAAWVTVGVLGPRTAHWTALSPAATWAAIILPVAVGSLGRIPVGMLADRFGARVLLAAVSVASAGALVLFAFANTPTELVTAAVAVGVAGTAFAAGGALAVRAAAPGRSGHALGIFGAGFAGGAGIVLLAPVLGHVSARTAALVLAGLLTAFGLLAAIVAVDRPEPGGGGPTWSEVRALLRLPATRHLCALYAVAFGPHAATLLFLPAYLHVSYGDDWREAVPVAAVLAAAAALARPAGAWLGGWLGSNRVLVCCLAVAGLAGVFVAFHPPQVPGLLAALAAVMLGLGLASGAILGYTGSTVPVHRAGTLIGTMGAAGGIAALVVPAALAALAGNQDSYAVALTLVSGVLLLAAGYVYLRMRWAGGVPGFPGSDAQPVDLIDAVTTVVALSGRDTATGRSAVVSRLATLATLHELVIVYAPSARRVALSPHALVAALRQRLQRHTIVAVFVSGHPRIGPTDLALVSDLVAEGAVTVAVVSAADPKPSANSLAVQLGADLVLRLDLDPSGRARLSRLVEAR